MGQLIGGIVGVYILHAVWEFVLFKRIFDDPVKGKLTSVLAAYFSASVLWGFMTTNGGPFRTDGFIVYLLGALVVGFFAYRRGTKIRDALEGDIETADRFS